MQYSTSKYSETMQQQKKLGVMHTNQMHIFIQRQMHKHVV